MKYLKKFENENGYQSFCNGEQYIEPHVVLISDTWDMRFQNITQSPLLGGITLRENNLDGDDTTMLGITVYNYLKEKCGKGTNGASYTLLDNENLYCTYDSMPNPSITNEQTVKITYCYYDEFITGVGDVSKRVILIDDNDNSSGLTYNYGFILFEDGKMWRDTVS